MKLPGSFRFWLEVSMLCRSLRAVVILCFAVVLLCGSMAVGQCSAASKAAEPEAKADSKAALMKADRDFLAATKARKADGWMEFMTEETTISRDKPYSGLQAIRAVIAEDYKDPGFQLTWDPETAVMLESGKMGYTSGHFVAVAPGPNNTTLKFGGQYITVWKKQKDGSWKVLWDGGSSTGPIK
jgi:ketosteroid isomerase-like protein